MSQPNYMIVDGALGDLVEEITVYIDQLNAVTEGNDGLEKQAADLMAQDTDQSQEETFKLIAQHSSILNKAPVQEFESAYNLVLHILTFSSKLTDIVPIVLSNLSAIPPSYNNGSLMVLSVLTNLFNILPTNSPLRYNVYTTILEFAESTNNVHMLRGQLKRLPKWLEEWGVNVETKKDMYIKVSQVLNSLDARSSYKYLFDASLESESQELSSQLVEVALASDFVYDFDELLGLSSVQALKTSNSSLYKLLEVVSAGDYQQFKSLQVSKDKEAVEKKVKVLAVAVLASQATNQTISYQEISHTIDVALEEVELWIIDTIRAGLVEGRLCQMEERFDIHRATPVGKFGAEQWKIIQQRLDEWKTSLKDVLEVVKNSRENAVKEKQSKLKHQVTA